MEVYKLFLDILTPVHIGAGSEIEPYEYVIGEQFHKIDLSKLLLNLSSEDQKQFNKLLETNIIACREFINKKFQGKDCVLYSSQVSEEIKAFYKSKIADPRNQLIIHPFLREASCLPYIPGSSLKGSLRTALIFSLLEKDYSGKESGDILEAILLKCERGWLDRNQGLFITKGLDPQKDPFRCIKITDVMLPQNTTVIQRVDTINKKDGVIKSMDIQLIKETTHSEYTGTPFSIVTELRYDEQLLKTNRDIKKKVTMQEIMDSNKTLSGKVIDYELEKYFNNHPVSDVYKRLKGLWSGLNKNEFICRLGWGSGYNSMTVNLKLSRQKTVKTRKLINGLIPMGWMKGRIEKIKQE
ncbi:MAG: type III-A CRISPR-associated RAMP protein Csm5 [Planctomycetes bacterium GWC2_39_26]|nr:MAG: type III-A CRISPR-associated RAMP protein Csm5 [Planctomycetes bacterium GWC2_39_26]